MSYIFIQVVLQNSPIFSYKFTGSKLRVVAIAKVFVLRNQEGQ